MPHAGPCAQVGNEAMVETLTMMRQMATVNTDLVGWGLKLFLPIRSSWPCCGHCVAGMTAHHAAAVGTHMHLQDSEIEMDFSRCLMAVTYSDLFKVGVGGVGA